MNLGTLWAFDMNHLTRPVIHVFRVEARIVSFPTDCKKGNVVPFFYDKILSSPSLTFWYKKPVSDISHLVLSLNHVMSSNSSAG